MSCDMEEVFKDMTQTLTEVEQIKFERAVNKPQISWSERAFFLSYWTEAGLEKESLLQEVMAFFVLRKYFIILDQGWSDWDFEIYRGIWSRAQVKVCTENHGGGKRLLRVQCALRMSQLATMALIGYSLLAVVAMVLGMPKVATATVVVYAINVAVILYQNFRLGRILYQVLEIVAKKLYLVPTHAASTNSSAARSAILQS